ncbi:uncharacterized protein LOC135496356 [Lineus longissimus]|uniref:uncharacterized protein LOC135496356 n=1 Tax=Lineus longissimus TaxID=88925 RepID=UPI00315D2ACD
MASNRTESADICVVCFQTRPLKVAGRCKHSFCTECLTNTLGSHGADVFSCPTCQADCLYPRNGVEGLVDFTGEEVAAEDLGPLVEQGKAVKGDDAAKYVPGDKKSDSRNETLEKDAETVLDRCKICRLNKREVQAINLCIPCGHLYLCGDCTEVHAKNKATHKHVVIPLQPERKKQLAVCQKHDFGLDSYCQECKQAVCGACVMVEHGDHTIEKFADFLDRQVDTLTVVLEERGERLDKLQELEVELILLTRIAPVVDKQDILLKEIEDHAQKCIDKIVKWKEDLKGQVKADYQIIRDIPECLQKVSERVQKMQVSIEQAGMLLAQTEYQPMYLDRVMKLQHDLEALAETLDEEGAGYTDKIQQLYNHDCRFTPMTMDSFGKMDRSQAKTGYFKPEEIFKFTMPVDSNDKFIPCVANLGQRYAIAHPIREGEPSDAVDIYDFPGKLKHTLKAHVPPLYDMCATPDGKLALLSDGTGDTSCCVKLFDAEDGYTRSTLDFDIAKPLSLGVTLQHQYVILGDTEQGERQIIVVDKDGRVEHTHVIKEEIKEKRINPSRITCGGMFIYVIGKLGAFSYKIEDTGIAASSASFFFSHPLDTHGIDISANVWDGCRVSFTLENKIYIQKLVKKTNKDKTSWTCDGCKVLLRNLTGADRETRVSSRGSLIVTSHGQTIRVYKE